VDRGLTKARGDGTDNAGVSAPSQPVPLRDGSRIEIRAIRGEDRDALRAGFEQLSAESRYRRFFGPMPELSARDLDYLTEVDHHDHEALVAADLETGEGVGVARFVRTGDAVAEPAMVVLDEWQGRGVGLALLEALVARARAEGVTRFEAPVLATNTDAIRLLERLGETTKQRSGREVQLTIELPAPGVVDPRWRTLLSTFASGALQPGRTLLERLWPRRPGSPDDERVNVILVGVDGLSLATRWIYAMCPVDERDDGIARLARWAREHAAGHEVPPPLAGHLPSPERAQHQQLERVEKIYKRLVALRNRYKVAFGQIDVQLKRRYDLSPNLVYTLLVLTLTAVIFIPTVAVPSLRRYAIASAALFAAAFGWAVPWLAQLAK